MSNIQKKIYSPKGKVIRDVIHGDVFVESKYLSIIDCPEFQRLRRIKQLSVGNLVFPSADHTRFSHSLGTFFVMKKIINHFEKQFENMKISIDEHQKETALAAALLHDIGHGPFSHAYEKIHPIKEKNIDHEKWTEEIIRNGETLNRTLEEVFRPGFSEDVISLIKTQGAAKRESGSIKINDFYTLLSSLISSQLDADRLDYLLRDSTHTGVSFGKIDVSRVIDSLRLSVVGDEYCVCIPEKYLPDIENYLLGRYQMYKGVYYHSLKVQMELLIKKIFTRAYQLHEKKNLNYIPDIIQSVFGEEDLAVKDYITLDDMVMYSTFMEWRKENDPVLSELCNCLANRDKFIKIKILDGKEKNIELFKNQLVELISNYSDKSIDLYESYFWMEERAEFSLYKNGKKNIWVSLSDGTYKDISDVSHIVTESKDSKGIISYNEILTYYHSKIMSHEFNLSSNASFETNFNKLIKMYDSRNHVEIEKKYYFDEDGVFEEVKKLLENSDYSTSAESEIEQCDYYYDTEEGIISGLNSTLRIRKNGEKCKITIKKPTVSAKDDSDTQSVRFEHEKDIKSANIKDHSDYIMEHLSIDQKHIDSLVEQLVVKNNRKKFMLSNEDVQFEVAFDNVEYSRNEKPPVEEKQLEIELKSEYPHRVNLKMLTDDIEQQISGLSISKESKYERGMKLTKNNH